MVPNHKLAFCVMTDYTEDTPGAHNILARCTTWRRARKELYKIFRTQQDHVHTPLWNKLYNRARATLGMSCTVLGITSENTKYYIVKSQRNCYYADEYTSVQYPNGSPY